MRFLVELLIFDKSFVFFMCCIRLTVVEIGLTGESSELLLMTTGFE